MDGKQPNVLTKGYQYSETMPLVIVSLYSTYMQIENGDWSKKRNLSFSLSFSRLYRKDKKDKEKNIRIVKDFGQSIYIDCFILFIFAKQWFVPVCLRQSSVGSANKICFTTKCVYLLIKEKIFAFITSYININIEIRYFLFELKLTQVIDEMFLGNLLNFGVEIIILCTVQKYLYYITIINISYLDFI